MAWYDVFNSKSDVAKELAEIETFQSPMGQATTSIEQFDELVDCTKSYLEDKYDKNIMVAFLDAFHR